MRVALGGKLNYFDPLGDTMRAEDDCDLIHLMALQGTDVRELFESIIPDEALMILVNEAGFQQRERRCDALAFIRSMIISASTGRGGRQAEVMKNYFATGADSVSRGSFYRWFGPALEQVMQGVKERAIRYARAQPLDLPGALGQVVKDWHIVDSMTVKLDKALFNVYPGAGDYAALKVHKRFSVGVGTLIDYHLSPAREHDSLHLTIDESWRGLGLLADLGYASMSRIESCERHDVRYAIRLKDSWKPKVLTIVRGSVSGTFTPGTDLDTLLESDVLHLDGRVIDADVSLGPKRIPARLVGVSTPKGYCFFLTNLEAKVGPRIVADLYRVRWEVELDNKLDKSCNRLDETTARTGSSVRAMVDASLIASMCASLLAHRHRQRSAPPVRRGQERTKPPIHAQTVAGQMAALAPMIARAFELRDEEAEAEWNRFAELLNRQTDPNWRRRPSILDQMRGWHISQGRKKNSRPGARAAAASMP
jgi:hypothetical protein